MAGSRGLTAGPKIPRRNAGLSERRLQRLFVIAAACLAALVPLILFAGFWVRSELAKSQREVQAFLGTRAAALSRRIDAELDQQVLALRAISALPDFDSLPPSLEDTSRRILSVVPHWQALAVIDTAAGRMALSTEPTWPDADMVRRAGEAAQSRKPLIDSPPAGTGRNLVLYMPVVRDNVVRSVIALAFDLSDLQEIAIDQSRDEKFLAVVTDRNDVILARSLSPERMIGQRGTEPFRRAVDGRVSGMFEAETSEGEPMSSAFSRSPTTGWVSTVSIDRRQLDRFSSRSVGATVAAGLLSLVLAGILAVFVVHTVLERRVSDERLSASRALGELDARLLATTQEALDEQRKSSSEREVLLREIYHRVKNNLQIVQSLLRLGSRDLKADQREPFEAAVRRVGAMARVHTLLYNSPDLASIDFKDYLDELLKELSEGFAAEERQIEAVLKAHSMRIPLDMAVPLAFISVEILTNSFRHAFPQGQAGSIHVEVGRDEPFGTLRIADTGVGFTHDPAAKRRLGLTIVRKLVQQIGGSIEEPEPGSSTFVIRFPLHEETGDKAQPEPASS